MPAPARQGKAASPASIEARQQQQPPRVQPPAKKRKAARQVQRMRRERARGLGTRFGLFVGLPTLLGALYFGLWATDMYESVAPFTVYTANERQSVSLESIIGAVPGTSSSRDALAVREYILSRDVLMRLNEEHDFVAHYKKPDADPVSRLAKNATLEEAFEYYLDRVDVDYDTLSSVLTLRVRAYSPEKAQQLAEAILEYSEEQVNRLSERARQDSIKFARREVKNAETRLAKARTRVLELQQEGADINPEQSASAVMSIRSQLQGELAKARAELSQARAFMRKDAPQVVALKQRVSSLAQQVAREGRRLVGSEDTGLNESIAKFEGAIIEKEFAEAAYQSALSSLEMARAEASRKHQYLSLISPPSAPDESTHPERWLGILTVFCVALAVFGIGALLIAAVREHARV